MISILIGFIFSGFISLAALIKKALSISGAFAATILGTVIFYFGGIYLSAIMVGFFASSSILTMFKKHRKTITYDIHEKSGGRDYVQVLANGGVGLIFAALWFATNRPVYLIAFTVSFAAANADTWASEIGILSNAKPISILNLKKVEKGVSGAISILGTISSLLGAGFIAAIFFIGYVLKFGFKTQAIVFSMVIVIVGFAGCIIDSLLGATIQAKYRCEICGKITERKVHHERSTKLVAGLKFINNDTVNFISVLSAALITLILFY
ncbi:DUF92 domain-containing protein [Candidatus Clostridium radicumherbarum]|uniref:DUF92 domain-containing protein n=1 Tax=Candidatus Clostridium radicumherbarum TaxID=3381662 RepID=A0ABW8TQH9_9CLOT